MLYAIVAILIIIADQLLKYWVTLNITLNEGIIHLIPGVISLVNIHNKGAAFGMLQNGRVLFIIIAVVFIAIVVYALASDIIKAPLGRWSAVGVLAGAVGNCIDRIMNGYVVDMFKFEFINHAIFNIADVFISVCGVIFCIYIILGKDEQPEAEPAPKVETKHRPNAQELREMSRRAKAEKTSAGNGKAAPTIRKMEEGESIPALRRSLEPDDKKDGSSETRHLTEEKKTPSPAKRATGIDSRSARPAKRKTQSEDETKRHGVISAKERRAPAEESSNPFAKWDLATKRKQKPEKAPRAESVRPRYPEMQRPIEPPAQRQTAAERPAVSQPQDAKVEEIKQSSPKAEDVRPTPAKRRPEPEKNSFDLEDIIAEFK